MTNGFSLLETVIAIAIVALGAGALAQAFFAHSRTLHAMAMREEAQRAASSQLALLDAERGRLPPEIRGQSASGRISWTVRAADLPGTREQTPGHALQEVEIAVYWAEDGQAHDLTVRTLHFGLGLAP